MSKYKVYDIDVNNKVVFVRVDFNVPIKNGVISNDNRIIQALRTIKYLISKDAKAVLMSHLGKIKWKEIETVEEAKKKNNLAPVAIRLSELLGKEVKFVNATRGNELEEAIKNMQKGDVILMQNTRYEKGEEKNDEELSKYWASLADAYVNDAFGTCHRAHSSTYGIPYFAKQDNKQCAIGYLVEKEVENLGKCVEGKEHPYVAILGGAKVSDKIKMIEGLLNKADKVLIGGAMAYTILKAKGVNVGKSLVEDDRIEYAKELLAKQGHKLVLPVDHLVVDNIENVDGAKYTSDVNIDDNYIGVDVGPKTIELFRKELEGSKIVFWNGPMGIFETEQYSKGTVEVCKLVASLENCFVAVGGGDSASAVIKFKYEDKISHVSTGGGASAELIENEGHLPGIDIIDEVK